MYKEYNDYEILYMISENDDDTYELLFKKYYPLILKYAKKYKRSFKRFGYEIDDILQIGYISLYKAARKYKYYSENMFYTFLIKLLTFPYIGILTIPSQDSRTILDKPLRSFPITIATLGG